MEKNGSIRKVRLISKFVTSQPGKQTIEIHTLSNISRSKGNQSVVRMRNIFLEKSKTTCGGKTIPKPFSKNLKIKCISLDQ